MTSALARVSKEQLQICTFKHCISCTNIFFSVKAKVLFNLDQAAHQNMRILAAAFVTIHLKRNQSCGQQLDKRKPSFLQSPPNQLLPLSHTNDHYSAQTRPGPKPESQHSRGFLHARKPAAMAVRALSSAWTRATSVAVCCTDRSKGSSSSLQRAGSSSPWKPRWIVPAVQSPFTGRCDHLPRASARPWGSWLLMHPASRSLTAVNWERKRQDQFPSGV